MLESKMVNIQKSDYSQVQIQKLYETKDLFAFQKDKKKALAHNDLRR